MSIVNFRNILNVLHEIVKRFSKFVADAIGFFSFPCTRSLNLERLFIFSTEIYHSPERTNTRPKGRIGGRCAESITRYTPGHSAVFTCRYKLPPRRITNRRVRRGRGGGGRNRGVDLYHSYQSSAFRSRNTPPSPKSPYPPQGPSVTCSLPCVYFFSTPTSAKSFVHKPPSRTGETTISSIGATARAVRRIWDRERRI